MRGILVWKAPPQAYSQELLDFVLFERAVTGVFDDGARCVITDGHLLKAIHRTPVRQERVLSVAWLAPKFGQAGAQNKRSPF